MADAPVAARDTKLDSTAFLDIVKSAGLKLKHERLDSKDFVRKTHGFDSYSLKAYSDILEPILSHKELNERHIGGELHSLEILVATKTIRHDKANISNTSPSQPARKDIWLLAIFVDEAEKEKVGRSFSLNTRFDIVEGEIFISFEMV